MQAQHYCIAGTFPRSSPNPHSVTPQGHPSKALDTCAIRPTTAFF
jgi:hypothetical protein